MMQVHDARLWVKNQLLKIYEPEEATSIAKLLCNDLFEKTKNSSIDPKQLDEKTALLLQHIPIQYVLGEAWFYHRRFGVNPSVLIPRPETEELVDLLYHAYKENPPASILDIGTGSGCIAITLQLLFPKSAVTAIDKSTAALDTAQKNAALHYAAVHFQQEDFLKKSTTISDESYDLIVSNPPYIPLGEKKLLPKNVAEQEPSEALFVPDEDALIFYKAIAEKGKKLLRPKGSIFVEIHQHYGKESRNVFEKAGYSTTLLKDMSNNDRFIQAMK